MMSLRERLVEFFHKGATRSSKIGTLIGAVCFFIYLSLSVIASILADNFLGFPKLFPTLLNVILSVPLTVIGLTLNLARARTIEEPELEKRSGKDWVEYKKKVPMFIPSLRKKVVKI